MLFRLTFLGCNESANISERPKAKPSRQLPEGRQAGRKKRIGGKSITKSVSGPIFSQFKSR